MAKGSVQAELVDEGELRGGKGRRYRSAEEREEMVRRFERSGLTQREFAQREGVKVPTLAYWLSKARAASGSESLRFQEVAISATAGFEAVLPCGTLLRAPSAEGLALLVRLVRG